MVAATSQLIPGVYEGIEFDAYAAWPAINASLLKVVHLDSPAEAWWDQKYGREESKAMMLGKARHSAVLEAHRFDTEFCVAEQCQQIVKTTNQPCTNSGTKLKDGVWYCGVHCKGESEETRSAISEQDFKACEYIRLAVMNHRLLSPLFTAADAMREVSLLWLDEATGELMKARLDMLVPSLGYIFDLKTTGQSSKPEAAIHHARKYGFAMQAAHYLAGCEALRDQIGFTELDFVFGCIKSSPPNILTPLLVDGDCRAFGEQQRRAAIARLLECRATDHWPGYTEELVTLHAADVMPREKPTSDDETIEESEVQYADI